MSKSYKKNTISKSSSKKSPEKGIKDFLKHLNYSCLLLSETNKLVCSLCFVLIFYGTNESSLKYFRVLLATEDIHFTRHNDLGSKKVTKDLLTFILIFEDLLITLLEKLVAAIPVLKTMIR